MTTIDKRRRILVVDDHPIVREGIHCLIGETPDLMVSAEAADTASALASIQESEPDGAIIDITLNESFGLDLVKDIRAEDWNFPILILSAHPDELFACAAFDAGAQGYLEKGSGITVLVSVLRELLAGGLYFSNTVKKQLVLRKDGKGNPSKRIGLAGLSDREREILTLIGRGMNNGEMCEYLDLDYRSVETYRSRIKRKLSLRNSAHLTVFAATLLQTGNAASLLPTR